MNNINLVPESYERSLRRKWYVGFGVAGGIIVFVTLITLALIPGYKIDAENQERRRLENKLLNPELIEVQEVLEEIEWLEGSRGYVQDMIDELNVPSHITRQTMDMVATNIPKGLTFNELNINPSDNSIIIAGMADSTTKVADYIMKLHNTDSFGEITYAYNETSDAELENLDWVDFNMQIQISEEEELDEDGEVIEGEETEEDIESEESEEDETDEDAGEDAGGEDS